MAEVVEVEVVEAEVAAFLLVAEHHESTAAAEAQEVEAQ